MADASASPLSRAEAAVPPEVPAAAPSSAAGAPPPSHDVALVAGTFDLLHAGHYALLAAAFEHGRRVEVWVTGRAMAAAKAAKVKQSLLPFEDRVRRLGEWLDAQTPSSIAAVRGAEPGPGSAGGSPPAGRPPAPTWFDESLGPEALLHPLRGRFSIHELLDPIGPAATEARYTCIVCSLETREGCEAINVQRAARGLGPLEIFVISLLMGDKGAKLSSSALRAQRDAASAPPPP